MNAFSVYFFNLFSTGWPKLHWFITDNLNKSHKDWQPPPKVSEDIPAYVEVCICI